MADIFVSYAREDKARVAPLVAALERQGWSIWWDPAIAPGEEFDHLIAAEIDKASAVVVVWTPASVASRWVRGEAREAADRGILVPVRFEGAKLPIDVRSLHTTDLDHWDGNCESPAFRDLVRALDAHLRAARGPGRSVGAQGSDDAFSVAVLPFVNMSADPEQEYFSDGLSEELINQLVKCKYLQVAGRTSSFAFKGKTDDLRLIGNRLGVNYVLEGSVRKAGRRLRITAQLVKCGDGFHLWSETYDRQLDDVFAIQDDVAGAVAKALGITFGRGEVAPAPAATTNLEAYDKYLRGVASRNIGSPVEIRHAVKLFREALALDPGFAPARAALICVYALMVFFVPETRAQTVTEMAESAHEALAREPGHWAGHLASGFLSLLRRDWLAADVAFARARSVAPPSDILCSLFHGLMLVSVGRSSEAVRALEIARAADPLEPFVTGVLQMLLDEDGRPAEARAEYERTRDLPGRRELAEHAAVIRLWGSGDLTAIQAQARRYLDSQVIGMPVLREVYSAFDEPHTALALLRSAFDDPNYQHPTRLGIIGLYAAHFGDSEFAVAAMRRAHTFMGNLTANLIWYSVLGEARRTGEFKQLVKDIGVYNYWRASGQWGEFARPKGDDDFEIIK